MQAIASDKVYWIWKWPATPTSPMPIRILPQFTEFENDRLPQQQYDRGFHSFQFTEFENDRLPQLSWSSTYCFTEFTEFENDRLPQRGSVKPESRDKFTEFENDRLPQLKVGIEPDRA